METNERCDYSYCNSQNLHPKPTSLQPIPLQELPALHPTSMNTVHVTQSSAEDPPAFKVPPLQSPRHNTPAAAIPEHDPRANDIKHLKEMCLDLKTGTDFASLLEVSHLLHQSRLKTQETVSDAMIMLNFKLPSAHEEMSVSEPLTVRKGGIINKTCATGVLASCASAEQPPVNWFHINTFYCDPALPSAESADLKALIEIGEALGITSSVIKNTMKNYGNGMICTEQGPGCIGIAFVDLVRVDTSGREVLPPKHLTRASSPRGGGSVLNKDMWSPDDIPSSKTASSIKTIQQQPIALFFSSKANTCLSVRVAPSGLETTMCHWGGIVKQLQEKTSLVSKKMDAAYLLFLLIADVINSIEPLLNMYGDALEGLDFLFDEYEPTIRRNLMSRRMQKDLWVIRRWGWLMSTTAQDLAVDPWDVFTEEQEKPIQMLLQQSNTLTTAAKAYLEKADSQENFFSRTQEQCTGNLLFNLTMCTLIMVPPTFFTGVYGMNFDVLPELHNENSYFALWGWCVLLTPHASIPPSMHSPFAPAEHLPYHSPASDPPSSCFP